MSQPQPEMLSPTNAGTRSSSRTRPKAEPFEVRATVPGRELGRVTNPDAAEARFGKHVMQPIYDGCLDYDCVSQAVSDDFAAGNGTHQMLRRAIRDGIESVPDGPDSLRRLFAELDHVPDWVDGDQLNRACTAYWRTGPLVSLVFMTAGVAGSDRAQGFTREFLVTNRFLDHAYIRSQETFRWLIAVTTPNGLRRGAEGFDLTVRVRMLHSAVRSAAMRSGRWNWNEWGTPINRTDQVASGTYPFTLAMTDGFSKLGIRYTDQELRDIHALWRYIVYLIGVPEEHLWSGPAHARELNDAWWAIEPGSDDACRQLIRALIELATPENPAPGQDLDIWPDAVNKLMPPLRMRAFIYGMCRYLLDDASCDAAGIPHTRWKYAGHALKPTVRACEVFRKRTGPSDEQVAEQSRRMFSEAMCSQHGDPAVATPDDVHAGAAKVAASQS